VSGKERVRRGSGVTESRGAESQLMRDRGHGVEGKE
jgi:hypothetical protein